MSDPHPLECDSAQRLAGPLTPEQIRRWATLIAAGEDEFPPALPPPDRDRLAGEVRALLRERLVDLIARAVARDLLPRRSRPDTEVSS